LEQSKLFSMEMMAMGETKIFGSELAIRIVKFPTGDVEQVHTMLFTDLATHHKSGPPGLTTDRPETLADARANILAKSTAVKRDTMTILELQGEDAGL